MRLLPRLSMPYLPFALCALPPLPYVPYHHCLMCLTRLALCALLALPYVPYLAFFALSALPRPFALCVLPRLCFICLTPPFHTLYLALAFSLRFYAVMNSVINRSRIMKPKVTLVDDIVRARLHAAPHTGHRDEKRLGLHLLTVVDFARERIFPVAQALPLRPAPSVWGERNTIFGNANDLVHGMVPTLLSPSESATTSSSNPPSKSSASTGRFAREAASAPPTPNVICALDASPSPTEPSDALALRLRQINCIYPASTWSAYLDAANLSEKYPYLVSGFRFGFIFDFPSISVTQTPPNKFSTPELATEFTKIVRSELQKDRYIGPFSRASLESHLGPFQTSPFSLIPKAGKPGKFRAIQNFSFPPVVSPAFPNPSINSFTSAVNFPCTWGSFAVASFLLGNLPPGSRIATRDVAEAFRSVPLHPSQYPAAVVRVGEDEFCVDTCGAFGARPSGGVYGHIQDAAVDIFRSQGIGPITKWVDDHIFAQVPVASLVSYNTFRASVRTFFASNGPHHAGGRLWYGAGSFSDASLRESDDDYRFPLLDLSNNSPRSANDSLFAYNMEDVDDLSRHLGIPWESSKDVPFSSAALYIGLLWDLSTSSVSLSPKKTEKYLAAIAEWSKRSTHSLDDVQQLYGKLLHASLVIPEGRAYLTGLETMLGSYGDSVLSSRHPPRSICGELDWWSASLRNSLLSRPIPLPKELVDIQAFSDASSGVGIAIVIGQHWRAWRLIPGWRTLNGSRDIGWAEAVGFELLIYAIAGSDESRRSFKLFGDNKGVVEGWWNNRSRNSAVNSVFRRIHTFLAASDRRESFFSAYVSTKLNPADAPSRGLYPSSAFLLAPIPIPTPLAGLIIDFDAPRTAKELQLGRFPPPLNTPSTPSRFSRLLQHTVNPSPSCPRPYPKDLTPRVSILRPHCHARDRLRRWLPSSTRLNSSSSGAVSDEDLERILQVIGARWETSTKELYGSGLLIYHVWCDTRGIEDPQRCPADNVLILNFISSCAGAYSGSSLRNIYFAVRAWHILHGRPWKINSDEIEAALEGASKLAPPQSRRPKRKPFTPTILSQIHEHFDMTSSLDVAVFACLTTIFWSAARVGEFTLPNLKAFNPTKHVKVSDVSHSTDRQGNPVTRFRLPHTKCSPTGEDVFWAAQSGVTNPESAFQTHITLNKPLPHEFLFSWNNTANQRRPLTRTKFLERVNKAVTAAGLEPLQGHGLRIGAVLEYLLRGVPFDVVHVIGRWSSDAFILYLRRHAVIIARYIQDTPYHQDFIRYTMPPVR
ncbi:hypothetical protein D9613_012950 [Agrocybe pediades]|uniref:Uncharacterized protein n=1 Tax=Agrocybe pediades TaxID=84607 RepID=A0A8H4QER9_9AGAR|nr:hypothetical protein D9613_012950 [Agrocybe pediades]